ncbi:unnamed protein product, partial [Ilex paraguariensis]
MSDVSKRLSCARQIDKILRKDSLERAKKSWFERNAESVDLVLEDNDSEEERVNSYKQKKASSIHLKKLQQELHTLLSRPLQPKSFSHRFLAGAGVSTLLQNQFEELANKEKFGDARNSGESKRRKLVIVGRDCVEPLQALRSAGQEVMDLKEIAVKQRNVDHFRRKRKEEKKRLHDQRRKQRKRLKGKSKTS